MSRAPWGWNSWITMAWAVGSRPRRSAREPSSSCHLDANCSGSFVTARCTSAGVGTRPRAPPAAARATDVAKPQNFPRMSRVSCFGSNSRMIRARTVGFTLLSTSQAVGFSMRPHRSRKVCSSLSLSSATVVPMLLAKARSLPSTFLVLSRGSNSSMTLERISSGSDCMNATDAASRFQRFANSERSECVRIPLANIRNFPSRSRVSGLGANSCVTLHRTSSGRPIRNNLVVSSRPQ
mmetsp:Transcript_38932/g.103491  ORF Transcript_38932/g.103491 Transcript_38932/m.103491 type:complete len:237 (-) Transcript_38932:777-1487(-)